MRRAEKRQADNLVGSLEKAHEQIKAAIEKKDQMAAMISLGDCQNTAISLGHLIERVEGEGLPIIETLEEYCEEIYQIYEELNAKRVPDAEMIGRALPRFFSKIQEGMEHDIKVRLEIVFFPYKAAMWDSLESVWQAAVEDPDCDAYVVPIPYYDKNPDGSFAKMHYEGDLYPDYVPILGYEDYDFESRKPDMIFIHNPYDQCNHMTSVPLRFYAKNLKQHTEQLVYIPYFILDESGLDNLDVMEDFCMLPAVLHADKVIVQSEAMRQAYINVMLRCVGEDSRMYWEKKIFALGSPKVDKLLNTGMADIKIPKDWEKKIRKPSGERKKVMLYNTSVNALFHHEEQMLKKMEQVFLIFKEHRDKVTLLWRPHPLMWTAIASMHPELRESYEKLVDWYKEEDWGIYDDSADLDRALTLSDGYYGDHSSLVQLCNKIGLPVMIQNVDI